jgi:hypothetical protein
VFGFFKKKEPNPESNNTSTSTRKGIWAFIKF